MFTYLLTKPSGSGYLSFCPFDDAFGSLGCLLIMLHADLNPEVSPSVDGGGSVCYRFPTSVILFHPVLPSSSVLNLLAARFKLCKLSFV